MLHWSSLIIFFVLSMLALWVADTVLQKNGIYFFSIVAVVVSAYFSKVQLFGLTLNVQLVIIPVVLYALLLTYNKYGSSESIRLFYITIFSVAVMFVLRFFEFALLDIFSNVNTYLDWGYLKEFVANVVAFACCCVGGYFFVKYVKLEKVPQILRTAIYLAIFCAVNSLVFVIITTPSFLSFVDALLVFLLMLAFDVVLPLLLGCYDFLTNRMDTPTSTTKTKKENPAKQEEKEKKLSNYFNNKNADKKPSSSTSSTSSKPSSTSSTSSASRLSSSSNTSSSSKLSSSASSSSSRIGTSSSKTSTSYQSPTDKK